ncbi:hypothetical protein [Carboxylicivirga marina]|uniref:STAS/SEC14 domain-containing protein n=1 Tax=Carboxylicivirga marina TaxID=2800988 RepID=A0ABS1HQT0_9BACT|nr:hypothetical protein [Carboxylicivirga marina]MBK3520030.1 hypothetical protein [Carboxylicivirga marina]
MKNIFRIRKKKDRVGKEIDFKNSWAVSKLEDKLEFFKRILTLVPDNSIWAIEGMSDMKLIEYLQTFPIEDSLIVNKGTIWPKQKTLKVLINPISRKSLIQNITFENLDWEIIHQHIYNDEKFYLTSYDNLHEACTWISN